jgi:hypothetical protein
MHLHPSKRVYRPYNTVWSTGLQLLPLMVRRVTPRFQGTAQYESLVTSGAMHLACATFVPSAFQGALQPPSPLHKPPTSNAESVIDPMITISIIMSSRVDIPAAALTLALCELNLFPQVPQKSPALALLPAAAAAPAAMAASFTDCLGGGVGGVPPGTAPPLALGGWGAMPRRQGKSSRANHNQRYTLQNKFLKDDYSQRLKLVGI